MRRLPLLLLLTALVLRGQRVPVPAPFNDIRWRSVGPFRGGRALAVAGVPSQQQTYYFGATGGGVFKTIDGGDTWTPVSDGQFTSGSIGAIAVSESDPDTI